MQPNKGLTLIELLVVIALLGLVGYSGYTVWYKAQANQALSASAEQLATIIESAHIFSRDFREEKTWGVVSLNTTTYALMTKDQDGSTVNEEEKTLLAPIMFIEPFSVVFDPGTGNLPAPVVITLTRQAQQTARITVNEFGVVTIEIQ